MTLPTWAVGNRAGDFATLAEAVGAPLPAGAPIRVQIVTAATPTGAAVPVESTL